MFMPLQLTFGAIVLTKCQPSEQLLHSHIKQSADGNRKGDNMTTAQTTFIAKVASLITDTRILKSVTIAQAILESGWGQSELTIKANALFGIKAGLTWKGKRYSSKTQECYDKVNFTTITAAFRGYNSWVESIADHTDFILKNSRFKSIIGCKDYKTVCSILQKGTYATAPNYAVSLISIIEQFKLYEYDKLTIPPVKPLAPTIRYITLKAGMWNVRKGAGIDNKSITTAKGGLTFASSKYVNGWYYIDSFKGYVGAKSVARIK